VRIEIARIGGAELGDIGGFVQLARARDGIDHAHQALAFIGREEIADGVDFRPIGGDLVRLRVGIEPFAHHGADAFEGILIGNGSGLCHRGPC